MKANAQTEAAVKAVLDAFADNYSRRDLEGLMSLFTPDADMVLYGTGADEKRVGLTETREQVQRDWSQSDGTAITYTWTSISAAGPVAWVAADVSFEAIIGDAKFTLPARLTGVLENRGEKWLIAQTHFSFPAAGQEEGESFPT